ncbi:MAG TPA: transglutaminase family protein [Phnomibacter sp.]|nr:transglutaminase family protein [Phnomibacter sp.]
MPVFKIHHITQYEYDRPVKESVSQLRVYPIANSLQQVNAFDLQITGEPNVAVHTDFYGNTVGDFSVLQAHQKLTIDSRLTVETTELADVEPKGELFPHDLKELISGDISLLRLAEPERIKEQWMIEEIIDHLQLKGKTITEIAWDCNTFIYLQFKYVKGITTVGTTVDEILHHRSGVCQDFAHVMLQILRTLGIPARYVSGYICPNKSGLRGEGATHAWVEFYYPPQGWVGIDPTNNVWVNGYHVVLATGRDFNDCTPVKGTFKGVARQNLSVYVSVGYEDGHVFEEVNQVKLEGAPEDELEPWQSDWMQAQQQ